jgi:saccharopine dehydrogenase (NADP+, L-glutamate forming)
MKNILILGAGLSATTMIRYLLAKSEENNWNITLADTNISVAEKKTGNNPRGKAVLFDINDSALLANMVESHDLVISMLPAMFHPVVARECIRCSKHMFTASYVSPEMKEMEGEIKAKNLFFMNECGVDPGIDHMSAMKVIHEIRHSGGILEGFESNTGGLIAPESDNNPWNYKFTWNPRNVILAGSAGARFLEDGGYKYVPYHHLYRRISSTRVLDAGEFEIYANRDSLSYREVYGLEDIKTLMRGTMRRPGYCAAWNCFVQLGMCDDSYKMEPAAYKTKRTFTEAFLPSRPGTSTRENFCSYLNIPANSDIVKKMEWLGMFSDEAIQIANASPAQVLQAITEPKWKLESNDKDMIVMQHKFVFTLKGRKYQRTSSLVVIGKDTEDTAMSITVGMPLAIAVELFLKEKISGSGVIVPITPDLYNPILEGMEPLGVKFVEEEKEV